ncbi:related to PHM7-similarity to A.thaliana hyp1 protein [Rhynchosporium agropyri]|uniref:Related to PHM7-similarity to A.thaliana hyp1 protein n=1 Tax=Rhynchosporium agropyri TaxID=914238 RepID=A0A1E1K1G7_9HELO|nr:related to PHM7-similarity to A.thaliana hyp1 protein [Rhynchosporium agropyri]
MSTTTSAAPSASTTAITGGAQAQEGISLVAFITALATSLIIFAIQMLAFVLLKNKLARIFKPKTYLVPERERTDPPPRTPWGWLSAIFRFTDREVINKCGLDAYFFLRYLQTLLVIFIPLALVILPILIPLNYHGGRGNNYANETIGSPLEGPNVKGLDVLAWGNVRPSHTHRYWAHLILALVVIIWVCGVFFSELRIYIKVRQDYLTSAEHRLKASATTVLVSAIPSKWLTIEALSGLYDVFPGGIRNIWINRNFDELLEKIKERDEIFLQLEGAETELVRACKKAQKKQLEKDEKAYAKQSMQKATKLDKQQKLKEENARAEVLAKSGGISTEHEQQTPHTVDDAMDEEERRAREQGTENGTHEKWKGLNRIPGIGGGLAAVGQGFDAVGQGIGKGFNTVGDTVVGGARGARNVGRDINNQVETTNGFMNMDAGSVAEDDTYDQYGRYRGNLATRNAAAGPFGAGADNDAEKRRQQQDEEESPTSSRSPGIHGGDMKLPGNKTRQATHHHGGHDGAADGDRRHWGFLKFWKAPAGGFASPVPTGYESGDEFPMTQRDGGRSVSQPGEKPKGFFQKVKSVIPFLGGDEKEKPEYPVAYNEEYKEDAHGAVWERYLKEKDRPTHKNPTAGWIPGWLTWIPFLGKKVDTIYWCRGELARLNLEIETDQKHPENFPLMNSAFIQFNHQVAAHMACQSVTHHVPKHMAPRTVEISPRDVIWDNMSIKWWEGWFRTAIVFGIVTGMVVLWTFPVAWTASLAQIESLANKYEWLRWLPKRIPHKVLQGIAGVLPALVLGILLALVPMILKYLAGVQGAQTGVQKQRTVQNYYFAFLFTQVFLVVSISGGVSAALSNVRDITSIPNTLATQLPKAANYFFSYMILQALSTSSGTLLQIATLILWYLLPKLIDNTARQKWKRNTTLSTVTWGTFFPVYTNFACIGIIYSVVSPIIIIFVIITFTLLWVAHRYNMLYVTRFQLDTGGLLYPRAINQTFTGLYVMQLCMFGLFLLVRDDNDNASCIPQAIIMAVALVFTVLYQLLLNMSFGPLFNYLPITFEDEAVLRDEAFERAQARRLGLVDEEEDGITEMPQHDGAIEMSNITRGNSKYSKFNPVNIAQGAGTWAAKSGRQLKAKTMGNGTRESASPHPHRRKRHRDIEAQKKIADALYGGYNDEIEDLTPDERDVLVRHAFQHYALRARRPTVWIPRDDIGVSDDEVKRTREFAGNNIWISNVGAALDGKSRVVYGRNPPDFSEIDLINL